MWLGLGWCERGLTCRPGVFKDHNMICDGEIIISGHLAAGIEDDFAGGAELGVREVDERRHVRSVLIRGLVKDYARHADLLRSVGVPIFPSGDNCFDVVGRLGAIRAVNIAVRFDVAVSVDDGDRRSPAVIVAAPELPGPSPGLMIIWNVSEGLAAMAVVMVFQAPVLG